MFQLVGVAPTAVEGEIPDDDHLALADGFDVLHTPGRLKHP